MAAGSSQKTEPWQDSDSSELDAGSSACWPHLSSEMYRGLRIGWHRTLRLLVGPLLQDRLHPQRPGSTALPVRCRLKRCPAFARNFKDKLEYANGMFPGKLVGDLMQKMLRLAVLVGVLVMSFFMAARPSDAATDCSIKDGYACTGQVTSSYCSSYDDATQCLYRYPCWCDRAFGPLQWRCGPNPVNVFCPV